MERKTRRTVIDISENQSTLNFEEAELSQPFTFPQYQKDLLFRRLVADCLDFAIVAAIYLIFIAVTFLEMTEPVLDKRSAGVYAAGLMVLVGVYFLLFMLSSSQTPGMKLKRLTVVTRDGAPLDPASACLRGLGYFISIAPLMLGFIWAVIDPEHLTWADKVSGTFLKKT
jgi:uncharacterized RDD family membrane protein YckC